MLNDIDIQLFSESANYLLWVNLTQSALLGKLRAISVLPVQEIRVKSNFISIFYLNQFVMIVMAGKEKWKSYREISEEIENIKKKILIHLHLDRKILMWSFVTSFLKRFEFKAKIGEFWRNWKTL